MKSKRMCKAERFSSDIISTLPQAILETILCLLPTKEAARTSMLSREWRYNWTKIPKLEFYMSEVVKKITEEKQVQGEKMDTRCKPFYDLHQILLLHQGPIHEFTLHIDLFDEDKYYSGLDQLLLYLSNIHKVKKLTLSGTDDAYWDKLPISIFSLHYLTDLDLSYFDLDYQPAFNGFGSLRSLYLYCIGISSKTLLHLLSNCPSLKSLTLLVNGSNFSDKDCTIIDLFKCLPMIEHFTIGFDFEWLVPVPIPQGLPTLLFHLKYFCIKQMCFDDDQGLAFLLVLIRCSPNLEKIKLDSDDRHACYEEYNVVWEKYSDVWLEHLVELEIESYCNSEPKMELVKFILARSPKLKKVSIKSWVSVEESLEMLEVLLRAPRVSRHLCLTLASKNFRSVNFFYN